MSEKEPLIDGWPLWSGLPPPKQKPFAYVRISTISLQPNGLFFANPDGSEPDVELKSEILKPLFLEPPN